MGRGRKPKKQFLSIDGWVNSTAKQCARDDIPIDTQTVGAVLNAGIRVIFDKIIHEKREVGETYSNDLFIVKIKERKERLHRNPATGEAVPKGAIRSISFKPSVKIKEALEEAFRKNPSTSLQKQAAEKNGVPWVDKSDKKDDDKKSDDKKRDKDGKKKHKKDRDKDKSDKKDRDKDKKSDKKSDDKKRDKDGKKKHKKDRDKKD